MSDAAMLDRWGRTASLMALLANINQSKDGDTVHPRDFIPEFLLPAFKTPRKKKATVDTLIRAFGGM